MEISNVDTITGYLDSVKRTEEGVLCYYENGATMHISEHEIKKIYNRFLIGNE